MVAGKPRRRRERGGDGEARRRAGRAGEEGQGGEERAGGRQGGR